MAWQAGLQAHMEREMHQSLQIELTLRDPPFADVPGVPRHESCDHKIDKSEDSTCCRAC